MRVNCKSVLKFTGPRYKYMQMQGSAALGALQQGAESSAGAPLLLPRSKASVCAHIELYLACWLVQLLMRALRCVVRDMDLVRRVP
jgi:hypothetical protein